MKKITLFICTLAISLLFGFASFAMEYDFLSVAEKVKQKIDIPNNYTEFSSYANMGDSLSYVLSWSGGDSNDGGVLTVVTDENGRIISVSQYKYGKYKGNYKLSSIDYDKACSIAYDYIRKIDNDLPQHLMLFKQPNYILRNNESYQVVYYRYENGLPCYDNYIVLLIDAYTKQVSEYRAVWEDYVKISPITSYISKEQALKKYHNEIGIAHGYVKNGDEIKIVYSTNSDGTRFINAYNGAVLNSGLQAYPSAEKYIKKTYFDNTLIPIPNGEIPKIDRERILENSFFKITSDYIAAEEALYCNEGGDMFVELTFLNQKGNTVKVTVNADTNEIVRFSSPRKNTDNSKMLKDSDCKKIATDFARKYVNSIFKSCKNATVLNSGDSNIYRIKYPLYVNGIPYHNNGIIIDVDRADGRVLNVEARMDTAVEFPLSIPEINYDKAYDVMVEKIGFELQYVPVKTTQGKELRAVYSFTPVYPVYVCGLTGKTCDADGNVYEKPYLNQYKDIELSVSKKAIDTVVLADIMVYSGNEFKPYQYVTASEFAQIIYRAFDILVEFDNYDEYVTHQQAVAKIVEVLGYGDIAKLSDTYANVFVDGGYIAPEFTGHAAIAKGLGIIKGNALSPKEYVTREYCAELIYNTITERNNSNEN